MQEISHCFHVINVLGKFTATVIFYGVKTIRKTYSQAMILGRFYEYSTWVILHWTLLAPFISESCIKTKINLIFIFTLLFGASKSFMKVSKAFIKAVEASQRIVKIEIQVNFLSSSGIGTGRVKICEKFLLFKDSNLLRINSS